MDTISRADAKAKGLTRYFTGQPCPHGHVAERLVSDCGCVECRRLKQASPKERERRKEYMRLYQLDYRAKYPDRVHATDQKRYWKDPEKGRQRARDSRARSTNNYKKALKLSYQKHKAKRLAESKAWRENNREQSNAHSRLAKAKRRTAEGKFTLKDVELIFLKQEGRCAGKHCRCDIYGGFEIDHILPIARGGSNWPHNIQLLCMPCNRSKGYKTEEEWLEYLHPTQSIPQNS